MYKHNGMPPPKKNQNKTEQEQFEGVNWVHVAQNANK
jgi:hypothetical protein